MTGVSRSVVAAVNDNLRKCEKDLLSFNYEDQLKAIRTLHASINTLSKLVREGRG